MQTSASKWRLLCTVKCMQCPGTMLPACSNSTGIVTFEACRLQLQWLSLRPLYFLYQVKQADAGIIPISRLSVQNKPLLWLTLTYPTTYSRLLAPQLTYTCRTAAPAAAPCISCAEHWTRVLAALVV